MGNIYTGMSIGFGFILFCILMATVWIIFRNLRKRMLPEQEKPNVIHFSDVPNEEKRQNRRAGVSWTVSIETSHEKIDAKTKDISLGGAFIICESPLPLKEQFHVTIDISDQKPLRLLAEVVWSNSNVPEDQVVVRGMGVRFLHSTKKDRECLDNGINDHLKGSGDIAYRDAA